MTRQQTAAESLGSVLRQARNAQRRSQEQVANEAGLSAHAYGCLERGRTPSGACANPTLDTILRVFVALGVEPPRASAAYQDEAAARPSAGSRETDPPTRQEDHSSRPPELVVRRLGHDLPPPSGLDRSV
ncbi:helix-turn-helix transcriptional regulator [Microbacterium sp. NEAU-LLC]|uniref:Helix-turn-helix transcriptional regulator n=1 Tax=Microbacterium helvum TaxID=2773713 RepID=A0ABR8NKH7_9MICO|nr:helix-turn-helix transcriptional regulator [Microbacterium helvum]